MLHRCAMRQPAPASRLLCSQLQAVRPPSSLLRTRQRSATQLHAASDEVKAVLFDMDGVLCASENLSRKAAAAVFQRLYGVTVQEDEFIPFGGQGEGPFLTGVAHKHSVASFDLPAAIAAFFDIYCNTYATREAGIGFPGAVELVRSCRAAGLRTAVASSAGRVKVDANLRAGGFEPSDFDSIVSAEDITLNKPHPDIFLVAARNVGVAPANCVVMEDAAAGVRAGKAAGCRVLGVMTTLSSAELTAEGADATVSCISNVALADLQALRYRQPAAAR